MTYRELMYKAIRLIDKGEIDLGEYEEMTKPLDREVEQELCKDAISRQAVLKIYNDWFNSCNIADKKENPKTQINALPPVTPQPQTGHWILNKERDTICCSYCNDKQKIGKDEVELLNTVFTGFRFCRYCGAKMESEG